MNVTITSEDGEAVGSMQLAPQDSPASIATALQQQFGVPVAHQQLVLDGRALVSSQSFASQGVPADALLVLRRTAPSSAAAGGPRPSNVAVWAGMTLQDIPPTASPEMWLEIADKNPQLIPQVEQANPKLAEALRSKQVPEVRMVLLQIQMEVATRVMKEQETMRALEQNPFDPAAQAQIEERIRLSNVQQNMEIAVEEMPEAFARVFMLYVPCEVNGVKVKAFVDSGAQSTIMSSSCAERCGIMRLVDKRFASMAVGVGTAKIIGRVHMASLKIGGSYYHCSFSILEDQNVDFLFGLDMLKRHQCCIDLMNNVLRLNDSSGAHEVPFLPEHEIPMSDRSDGTQQQGPPPAVRDAASSASASASAPGHAVPLPASTPMHSNDDDAKIQQLVALGFDPQQAATALRQTNGNVEMAAGLLFEGMQ